jgi:cell division protein FtsB
MKIIAGFLILLLAGLQYRLWIAPDGMREVWRVGREIASQQSENHSLVERNRTLAAEVYDLKKGRTAIEERARTDLGMIGAAETFFQVAPVTPDSPAPDAEPEESARHVEAAAH